MESKRNLFLLTLFFGGIGLHKFYLGQKKAGIITPLLLLLQTAVLAQTSQSEITEIAKINKFVSFKTAIVTDKETEQKKGVVIMRVWTIRLNSNVSTYGKGYSVGYPGSSTDLEGMITKEELEEAIVYLEDVDNKIQTADKSAIFRYEFESKARITVLHNSGGWRIQLQAN